MFRGKETGNKITRRISAAILALVLVITSVNVDWNVLRAEADPNPSDYITVTNGGYIAQTFTFGGAQAMYLSNVGMQVSSGDDVKVEGEVTAIYRGSGASPTDGEQIYDSSASGKITVTATRYTGGLNESAPDGTVSYNAPGWIYFDFNKVDDLIFLNGETVTVVVKLTWSELKYPDVDIVRVSQDSRGQAGYYKNADKWTGSKNLMVDTRTDASSTPLVDISSSVPEDIYLRPNQQMVLSAETQKGYNRNITYTLKEGFDFADVREDTSTGTATVTARRQGKAVVTIGGVGVKSKDINVHVVDIAVFNPEQLVFNNTALTPQISVNGATSATTDLVVSVDSNATDVGTYTASVTGKPDDASTSYTAKYPGYSNSISYAILPKDISEISAELITTAGNTQTVFFAFDHSTGTVLDTSYFVWEGRNFYAGSDFNAIVTAVNRDNIARYVYTITLEGKRNFKGSTGITYTSEISPSAIDISSVYGVTVDRPEVTYAEDEDGNPIALEPSLTFTRKYPEPAVVLPAYPSDVKIVYSDNDKVGEATVTITSSLYSGSIIEHFRIKRNISLEDNFLIQLAQSDKAVVASYNSAGQVIPVTPTPEKVVLDSSKPVDDQVVLTPSTNGIDGDYILSYNHNDSVGTATVTVTGINDYSGSKSTTFRILPNIDLTAKVIIGSAVAAEKGNGFISGYQATYTGSPINISPTQVHILVDDDGDGEVDDVLSDKFYAVNCPPANPTYPDRNLNVDSVGGPKNGCMVITTTPDYGSQTLTVYFEIIPCQLRDVSINVLDSAKFTAATTYTGYEINLNPATDGFNFVVKGNNSTDVGTQFVISKYENNINAGNATVYVAGTGNYVGTASTTFTIKKRSINDPEVIVSDILSQTFDGNEKRPDISITYKGKEVDGFSIKKWENNKAITTADKKATAIVEGTNNFTGERVVEFDINPIAITNGDITFQLTEGSNIYNHKLSNNETSIESVYTREYDGSSIIPSLTIIAPDGRTSLVLDEDYYLVTENNTNARGAGEANPPTLYVYGKGNYASGNTPVAIKFNISKRSIDKNSNGNITVSGDLDAGLTIRDSGNKDHKKLREGEDYEIIRDPSDDGSKMGEYKATIRGLGNYRDSMEQTYIRGTNLSKYNVDIASPIHGNVYEGVQNSSDYKSIAYMGNNRPIIVVWDASLASSTGATPAEKKGVLAPSAYTIEYEVTDGDGYSAGSKVTGTITGNGNPYFGIITFKYQITEADFEVKNAAYAYDFDITLNGQTKLGKDVNALAIKQYKYEFTYNGNSSVEPELTVVFNPTDRLVRTGKYDYIPESEEMESFEVSVVPAGKLDFSAEASNKNLKINPAKGSGFTVGGSRTLVYDVKKTELNADPDSGNIKVTGIADSYPYKGTAYTTADIMPPTITLNDGTPLVYKRDFDYEIKSNVTDGTINVTADGAYVEIKGLGDYTGAPKIKFMITPLDISGATVNMPEVVGKGATSLSDPEVIFRGNRLNTPADYTFTPYVTTNVGSQTMTITGTGNYTGTITKTYTVKEDITGKVTVNGIDPGTTTPTNQPSTYIMAQDGSMSGMFDPMALLIPGEQGSIQVVLKPNVTLKFKEDYDVKLTNLSSPGTGQIEIIGIGNYTGSEVILPIKVVGEITGSDVITSYDDNEEIVYSGAAVNPPKVSFRGTPLRERDYVVNYYPWDSGAGNFSTTSTQAPRSIGRYKLEVKGVGSYQGTVTREFYIVAKPMAGVTLSVDAPDNTFSYTGSVITPKLTVSDGRTPLVLGQDYDINLDSTQSETAPGEYKINITGKGNYALSGASITWRIVANLEDKNIFEVSSSMSKLLLMSNGELHICNDSAPYDGGNIVNKIEVKDKKKNDIVNRQNNYRVTYEGDLAPGGYADVIVEGIRYYTGSIRIEGIPVYALLDEAKWMDASTILSDIGAPVYAYTGSLVNPVTNGSFNLRGTDLQAGTDYTVGALSGGDGIAVGNYNVTLTGKEYYLGTKEVKYSVRYDLSKADMRVSPISMAYDGTPKEPTVTVRVAGNTLSGSKTSGASDDYRLAYENNENAGTAKAVIYNIPQKSFNSQEKTFEITRLDMSNKMTVELLDGDTHTYTGDVIEPKVSVTLNKGEATQRVLNADEYDIFYSAQRVNATTNGLPNCSVTVSLKGNYQGSKTVPYTILPKSLNAQTGGVDDVVIQIDDVKYSKNNVSPKYTVKDGERTLVEGQDFTITPITAQNVGEYSIEFTGKGNYKDKKSGTFKITAIDLSEPGVVTVTLPSKVYDNTDTTIDALKAAMKVTVIGGGGASIPLDSDDYVITVASIPRNAGDYPITIKKGSQANFLTNGASDAGATATYTITKKFLSNGLVNYNTGTATAGYTSQIQTEMGTDGIRYVVPNILVNPDFEDDINADVTIQSDKINLYDNDAKKELYNSLTLAPEVGMAYANNKNAGIATLTFTALESGNYTGEIVYRFKIGKDISTANVVINPTSYEYDGDAKKPEVVGVTYSNSNLEETTHYTVSYEDNPVNVGSHYVFVRGTGKYYYGEARKEYKITKRSKAGLYANFAEGALPNGYWVYNGTPATPGVVVYDSTRENAPVDPNEYTVTYSNNTAVGTAYYRVNMKESGNYESGVMINYSGGSNAFQIVPSEIQDGDLEIRLSGTNPYTFTGRKITPTVMVYHNGVQIPSSNYTVSYDNNILPGQAQVSVLLRGNYEGYASKTFDIVANITNTATVKFNAPDRRWTGQPIDSSGIKGYLISNPVKELVEGVDYTVDISPVGGSWDTAQRAKADIIAIGAGLTGTRTIYFNVTRDLTPGQDPNDPGYVGPDKPDPLPDTPGGDDSGGGGGGGTNPPTTGKDLNSTGITATVIAPANGFTYNGIAFTPSVIVMDGTKTLTRGNSSSTTADYYVEYRNNINAGTAYADIKGINAYRGTLTRSFLISGGSGTGSGTQGSTITIPGLSATASGTNSARLAWGSVSGVNSYTLTWRGSNGTTGSQTVSAGSTSATVNNLSPGVTYTFTLTAYGSGNSTGSAQAVCTTQASGSTSGGTTNITPVSGLTGVSATTGTATLSWVNPQDGTYYEVYRSTSPGSYGTYIGSVVNGGTVRCVYSDRNSLVSGRTYYYWIRPYKYVNGSKILGSYSSTYIAITVR